MFSGFSSYASVNKERMEIEAKAEKERREIEVKAEEERLEMLRKMIDNGAEKEFILKVGYIEEEYERVLTKMNK